MATVRGNSHTENGGPSNREGRRERGLPYDRVTAVLIVVGMIALFGLIIWLASLGGPAPSSDFDNYDLWMGS